MSDSEVVKRIGINAKGVRQALRLTLQDVADRSGLAKSYVWEIERGEKTNPSITALLALGSALGCSLDDLVGSKKYMEKGLRPEAMRIAVEVDALIRAAVKADFQSKAHSHQPLPPQPNPIKQEE